MEETGELLRMLNKITDFLYRYNFFQEKGISASFADASWLIGEIYCKYEEMINDEE